jgi:hypothetical protein
MSPSIGRAYRPNPGADGFGFGKRKCCFPHRNLPAKLSLARFGQRLKYHRLVLAPVGHGVVGVDCGSSTSEYIGGFSGSKALTL